MMLNGGKKSPHKHMIPSEYHQKKEREKEF